MFIFLYVYAIQFYKRKIELPRDAMRQRKRGLCCRQVSVRHVRVLYPGG